VIARLRIAHAVTVAVTTARIAAGRRGLGSRMRQYSGSGQWQVPELIYFAVSSEKLRVTERSAQATPAQRPHRRRLRRRHRRRRRRISRGTRPGALQRLRRTGERRRRRRSSRPPGPRWYRVACPTSHRVSTSRSELLRVCPSHMPEMHSSRPQFHSPADIGLLFSPIYPSGCPEAGWMTQLVVRMDDSDG
jgi:hypothetical protein